MWPNRAKCANFNENGAANKVFMRLQIAAVSMIVKDVTIDQNGPAFGDKITSTVR